MKAVTLSSGGRLPPAVSATTLVVWTYSWASGHGRLPNWPEARITGLWEHHAVVRVDGPAPALGEVVAVVPNHVCTAVNLVPELLVAADGQVADRWPVAARAANR
jgi:D-serine deaminase-like pyridoxal phosphate-dependent protein